MPKTITISQDKLLVLKETAVDGVKATNTNRYGSNIMEVAPEVDKYKISGEDENGDVIGGGNYFHINEGAMNRIPKQVIPILLKYKPNEFSRWAVITTANLNLMPKYFEKKSYAIEYKKWLSRDWRMNPVIIVDLNSINFTNESYGVTNKLSNIDLSCVGKVEYKFDFDEDEYEEWLSDNGLQNCDESRLKYYAEEYLYEVDYLDNETFHYMAGDQMLSYDELIDLFGESMAKKMLENCMRDGSGYFETYELYEGEKYDINNPQELNDIATKLLRHGEYFKDCRGFILSNGEIVYTEAEHSEVTIIPGINSKFQFIELGNIRLLPNSIDIGAEPTWEQMNVLRQVIASYADDELFLDIFADGSEIGVKYVYPDYRYVLGEIDRFYSEGIKPQGSEFYESTPIKSIMENFDFEVDSSEINLSSFKKKHELAPNIWNPDGKLNSRIRLKLLDIADDFWEFVNLKWVKPNGIILTGSICNFNWSQYSDIDLHLIVDFDEIDEKTEFVKDYLDSKKNEWNNEHSGLEIMGYKVELYVQNTDEIPQSSGIYDLEENDWVREPSKDDIKPIALNKFSIKDKAAKIMTIIDDMYDSLASTDDSYKIEQMGDDADYLWKKVKKMRQDSLDKDGESGSGNIVYKILRRSGYLDRLYKLSNAVYDKTNSIRESKKESIKKYITLLKNYVINEESVADGSSEGNPYNKRWKAEREALKSYICNYGCVMQSKEDNKNGKLYKCLWDKGISQLIGYNYCLCVQWDEINLKPKSVVYIRALDKFTPNIRRNIQYDTRGVDNQMGTYDDLRYESAVSSKPLITESKNSKRAHMQTRKVISEYWGISIDDPKVEENERYFEKSCFGEGKRVDWFIVLEPNAYHWYMKCLSLETVNEYLDWIFRKATTFENPSEYVKNFRDIEDFDKLEGYITKLMDADNKAEMEQINGMEANLNSNYNVLGPLDFAEAAKYGDYSGYHSGEDGRICYTQAGRTWNDYSHNGEYDCYLLLRNDWEDLEGEEHDGSEKNNNLGELSRYDAYDDYGLSMIFVFISNAGELKTCNTRWNHEAKYAPGHSVDMALNQVDISKLMGVPFGQIFDIETFDDKVKRLEGIMSKGEDVRDYFIFDDYRDELECGEFVKIGDKWNLLSKDGTKFLIPQWVTEYYCSKPDVNGNRIIRVNIEGGDFSSFRDNLIKPNGEFLWKHPISEWLTQIGEFKNGYYKIAIKDSEYNVSYNLMNANGDLISKSWFLKIIGPDNSGIYGVNYISNGKVVQNFMRVDGSFVFKEGYVSADLINLRKWLYKLVFPNGEVRYISRKDRMFNICDENGNPIGIT